MPNEKKKKRPFTIIYNDTFLKLSTVYEKAMYMALKMHVNAKGQCFPSVGTLAEECGMGAVKASAVLKELEKKGIIKKEHQYLENGGKTSNLYTVCDELDEQKEVKKKADEKPAKKPSWTPDLLPEWNSLVNGDQKKEASRADQADQSESTPDTSNKNITNSHLNNNTESFDSQDEKKAVQTKYSEEFLKNQYEYQVMITEFPAKKGNIDICIDIIATTINNKKDTIRIQKEEIQREKVAEQLLKLTKEDILWAIAKFEQQPTTIHYPKAYLLTLLYDAKSQRVLDLQNRQAVAAAAAAPQPQTPKAVAKGTETFRNFTERQNNKYMEKILEQYSLPPEDQAADAGEEAAT